MPLMKFDNKDSIPSEFQDEVKEKDGKFEINLSLTSKLSEFRDNNVAVAKERDELKATVTTLTDIVGEDASEFNETLSKLRETQQQVDDGKLTKQSDITAELTKRTEKMQATHTEELSQKDAKIKDQGIKLGELGSEIKRNTIHHAVQSVINSKDSGVQPSAAGDIAHRAMSRFVVEGGEVIAKNADGAIIYGNDGTTPESLTEWMESLKKDSPHFFIQSNGGGGGGGDKKHGGMDKKEFEGLSGRQKLAVANREQHG